MFYIIITTLILIFFLILIIVYNFNLQKKQKNVDIIYEDVNSLNVSKIVKKDNDLDFIRNNFWYKYKQSKIINRIEFYELKNHFEQNQQAKIVDLIPNIEIVNELKIDTDELIQIITSDVCSNKEIAQAFYLLEKELK